MTNLYIHAHPAQMLTFQLVKDDEVITNKNYSFKDYTKVIEKYLQEKNIDTIFIVGNTAFADKIGNTLYTNFNKKVNIERIKNA